MKIIAVLAMHGQPPKDFPKNDMLDYFKLHFGIEAMGDKTPPPMRQKYELLETKMRTWPRTPENDPYYSGSYELAQELRNQLNISVYVGFNEFCAPSLTEILEKAVKETPDKIIIITPMMTRGGEHSERDIPTAITSIKKKFPTIDFSYLWPFETSEVAKFLADQVKNKYFT